MLCGCKEGAYLLGQHECEKLEFYMVVKKKALLYFVTAWMDLENIMLSGKHQSEKEKYYMISLTCGI